MSWPYVSLERAGDRFNVRHFGANTCITPGVLRVLELPLDMRLTDLTQPEAEQAANMVNAALTRNAAARRKK